MTRTDGTLVLQSSTVLYRMVTSLGVYADSGNGDANTNDTWFDSGQAFYLPNPELERAASPLCAPGSPALSADIQSATRFGTYS